MCNMIILYTDLRMIGLFERYVMHFVSCMYWKNAVLSASLEINSEIKYIFIMLEK